jgi:hypothetical protein
MNSEIPNKAKNDPLAFIALGLALISYWMGPLSLIFSIPAIICSRISLKRIKENDALEGDAYAIAAMVIGYVSLFFYLIIILMGIKIFGHSTSLPNLNVTLPH